MPRLSSFLAVTRPKFLPLSVVPILITASIIQIDFRLSLSRVAWCIFGVVMIHAAGNVVNDCYDFLSGADKKNTAGRYSGGSGIMPKGLVQVWEAKVLYSVLFLVGLAVALVMSEDSWWPLIFAGGGTIAALTYTMPPFKLSYRGFGELLVAISFGPGIMMGTNYVLTGSFSVTVLLVSFVVGLLIGGVLLINEFRDAATDRLVGKKTLAVRVQNLVSRLSTAK